VAGWIALFVLVPMFIGGVAGVLILPGTGSRQAPAVAGFCTLGIVVAILIVGDATTPQSACGGTGCDTGYGLGAMLLSIPVFVLALPGVLLGRLLTKRSHQRASASPPN
jgi:hypothetical protein